MSIPKEKADYDQTKNVVNTHTTEIELKHALAEIIRLLRKIAGE